MTPAEAERFMATKTRQPVRRLLSEMVAGEDVWDLGCGKGMDVSKLYRPEQYTGLDCSAELIKIAQRDNPDHHFFVCDISRLPISDAAIPVSVIKSVLEHVPSLEDARAIYNEAVRASERVLIAWHTPPIYSKTEIIQVQAELERPIYQNRYAYGSFDREDLQVEISGMGEFTVWDVSRR